MQNSKNKPFQEVPGGEYDPFGFYYTPDGSFWDPDGIYFNSEGYDHHGGYYDEKLEYIPGPGWINELLCYEDEKDNVIKQMKAGFMKQSMGNLDEVEEDDLDEDGDVDDIYEEIDYDKLIKDEERRININKPNFEINEEVENNSNEHPNANKNYNTNNRKNVYNPRNVAQSHYNNMKNLSNDINNLMTKYEKNDINEKSIETEKEKQIEKILITPDMLFNKIPENLKPKNIEENKVNNEHQSENIKKIETKIEVDSLFG